MKDCWGHLNDEKEPLCCCFTAKVRDCERNVQIEAVTAGKAH